MRASVLLLLVSVLVLIAACGERERDRYSAMVEADLKVISNALNFYKQDCGYYPTNKVGFEALLKHSSENCNQDLGGYLPRLPNDPWGNPYLYHRIDENNFEIATLGKDGKEGGSGLSKDVRLKN